MAAPVSFAAAAVKKDQQRKEEPPVKNVQIEGLALSKIVKHCRDLAPNNVSGQLLGLDIGSTLEVTNCFPFPTKAAEQEGEDEGATYQLEMMRCLREVNVDNNTVGWYQSSYFGSYQTLELVENFVSYQESIRRCVCVVFDPHEADQGGLGLKALKLKDKFLALFKANKVSASSLNEEGITSRDVFQELPVTVTNSSIVSAMFQVLGSEVVADKGDFDRLHFDGPQVLEKNLDMLMDSMADYHNKIAEVSHYHRVSQRSELQHNQWLQKRKLENAQKRAAGEEPLPEEDPNYTPTPEPNRVENYLISNQAGNFCERIVTEGGQTLQKLCLMDGLYDSHSIH